MADAPDPDMALNNLERLAAQGERAALFQLLGGHPGALHLVGRVGGTSQFLADTRRRRPTLLSWLLEPGTMRQWLADELASGLAQSASAFTRPEARWNALRRFKYRQLLRIASRDILGDADLTVTTEELSRMADVCLAAAWWWTEEDLVRRFGEPRAEDGSPTGFAVIGMGKLGGDELNYSSDIDLVFRAGMDPDIVAAVRGMKTQIDKSVRAKGVQRRHVKLGMGGIREVEFLVQALQLLYSGDDPWLRERNSLRAIFRLTERGYLPQSRGRFLGEALRFLRAVEHRLQIVDEFQTHTLPEEPASLARLARRLGSTAA